MRRSVVLLSVYNWLIYIPLILICISGRAAAQCRRIGRDRPAPGDLVDARPAWRFALERFNFVAPFGAVMATVSTYLVVISSGIVRDLYQGVFRPAATENELRRASYLAMIALGALGIAATLDPPTYLQSLIVFSATTTAATFVVPAVIGRLLAPAAAGALAAMLVGAATVPGAVQRASGLQSLWIVGLGPSGAYRLLGLDPIVWGLAASFVAGIVGSAADLPAERCTCLEPFRRSTFARSTVDQEFSKERRRAWNRGSRELLLSRVQCVDVIIPWPLDGAHRSVARMDVRWRRDGPVLDGRSPGLAGFIRCRRRGRR